MGLSVHLHALIALWGDTWPRWRSLDNCRGLKGEGWIACHVRGGVCMRERKSLSVQSERPQQDAENRIQNLMRGVLVPLCTHHVDRIRLSLTRILQVHGFVGYHLVSSMGLMHIIVLLANWICSVLLLTAPPYARHIRTTPSILPGHVSLWGLFLHLLKSFWLEWWHAALFKACAVCM